MKTSNTAKISTLPYGLMVLLQYIIWGFGNPLTKIGLLSLSPFYCLVFRFFLAFFVLLFFFHKNIKARIKDKEHKIPWKYLFIICIFNAMAFIFCNLALNLTTATSVGFLFSLSVLFTPFLSTFFLKTKFEWKILLILPIVSLGLYFLCTGSSSIQFGMGEILALLSSFSLAVTFTLSSKYLPDVDSPFLSTLQTGVTALVSLFFAFAFDGMIDFSTVSGAAWGTVLYLALFCTCIAYLLQNTALKHVSPNFVSLAFCSCPIFTAFFSYLLLGETLSLISIAGGGIVIACIAFTSLKIA